MKISKCSSETSPQERSQDKNAENQPSLIRSFRGGGFAYVRGVDLLHLLFLLIIGYFEATLCKFLLQLDNCQWYF